MRIVSLLASATEIVCELGAGDQLVGRSHECDSPAWVTRLPQCSEPAFDVSGSSREIDQEVRRRIRTGEPLYLIHADLVRELRPDLVITQTHCEVCAITPGDVERSGACAVPVRQLALSASTLAEIFEGVMKIAAELGLEDRGSALVARECTRIDNVRRRTAGLPRPKVAVLEWIDPLFTAGNWGPELVGAANGEPAFGAAGEMSARITPEQLVGADPDWLIIAPCGFDLGRALRERPLLEQQPYWRDLRAVREGRVAFADGNRLFNRSGISVAQTAEILAEILHGIVFESATEGIHWCHHEKSPAFLE